MASVQSSQSLASNETRHDSVASAAVADQRENLTSSANTSDSVGTNANESMPSSSTTANSNETSAGHDAFECNICFDTAKDAVVTLCGHLFW